MFSFSSGLKKTRIHYFVLKIIISKNYKNEIVSDYLSIIYSIVQNYWTDLTEISIKAIYPQVTEANSRFDFIHRFNMATVCTTSLLE